MTISSVVAVGAATIRSFSLIAGLCTGATACGSHDPPPIVDPGGPFHTLVPGDKTISALNPAEVQVLCADLVNAHESFLYEAIAGEESCRETSDAAGRMAVSQGGDYQTACQSYYDDCKANLTSSPSWFCPLPASDCRTTVLALSACLNEVAAATPVSSCVGTPLCDLTAPRQPPPKTADLPPTPACAVLNQNCPSLPMGSLCGN
jgi:hypothetical protein